MSQGPLIRAERYCLRYPEADADALSDLGFEVAPGERVAVVGQGGSGRTTLAKALVALVPGQHPATVSGILECPPVVGYVSQDAEAALIEPRAGDDVGFGLPEPGRGERVAEALAAVGLAGFEQRATGELSGGQVQRVAIAGALARGAALQVLDDPTSELDAAGRADVLRALEGKTAVVTTNDPLVTSWASRVLVLREGRIVFDGAPGTLFEEPARARAWGVRSPATAPRRPEVTGTGPSIAEVRELDFTYPGGIVALQGASLSVRRGEIVALRGANGSGKSTMARCLMGILPVPEGTVRIDGSAAMVLQNPDAQLFADTVEDEVGIAVRRHPRRQERVAQALAEVGLSGEASRHPLRLTRSQRQLVAVASALACEPDLLILDEPTAGLDAAAFDRVVAAIGHAAARGAGVVLITHDEELAALATRTVTLQAPTQAPAAGEAPALPQRRWAWDFRVVGAITMVAVLAAMIMSSWGALAALILAGLLLIAVTTRRGPARWATAMLPVAPVAVCMGLFGWWLPPSWVDDPAAYAATLVLRLVAMVTWTVFLLSMTDVEETVALVRSSRLPASLVLVLTMALRFIPTLRRRLSMIRDAQQARGITLGAGGPLRRLRSLTAILIPLFVGAIKSANDLADALTVRGTLHAQPGDPERPQPIADTAPLAS